MSPSESEAAVELLAEEFLFDEFQTDREDDRKICLECDLEVEIRDAYGDETFAVGHYGCPRCLSWTLGVADPEGRLMSDDEATELFAAVSGFEWPGSR